MYSYSRVYNTKNNTTNKIPILNLNIFTKKNEHEFILNFRHTPRFLDTVLFTKYNTKMYFFLFVFQEACMSMQTDLICTVFQNTMFQVLISSCVNAASDFMQY